MANINFTCLEHVREIRWQMYVFEYYVDFKFKVMELKVARYCATVYFKALELIEVENWLGNGGGDVRF